MKVALWGTINSREDFHRGFSYLCTFYMTTTTSNKPIIIMDTKTHHSEAEASAHHCPKDPDPKFNPEVQPAAAGPAGTAQRAGLSSLIDNGY